MIIMVNTKPILTKNLSDEIDISLSKPKTILIVKIKPSYKKDK